MNTLSKLLISFIVCVFAPNTYGQTVHALVACVTDDPKIGEGAICNMQNMSKLIQDAIGVLDCELVFEQFDAPKCTKTNVTNWINSLDVQKDDIVIFFYSGHGGRAYNDPDPFPQMCMNQPSRQELFLPVSHVDKLIAQKNPKLRIIITECCNSEASFVKIKPMFAMSNDEYSTIGQYNLQALRELFLNTEGKVMITSSKATEYSWMYPDGGWFINNFIDVFQEAVCSSSVAADWNSIFEKTHDKTYERIIPYEGKTYRQEPYASIVKERNDFGKDPDKPRPKIGSLFESLQYLVNESIDVDTRLAKISAVKNRHFTSNAKVMTIASNGTTVVDYEDVDVFLRRIVLSPYIKQINILNGDNNNLNSLIKVHELRK